MALQRSLRLSKEKDITRILSTPHRAENKSFRLFFRKNYLPQGRFAFLISKKVAKSSVKRNLLKRRAGEFIRRFYLSRFSGYDIVVFFKKETAVLNKKSFYQELESVLRLVKNIN